MSISGITPEGYPALFYLRLMLRNNEARETVTLRGVRVNLIFGVLCAVFALRSLGVVHNARAAAVAARKPALA
jgi:hypothetical protein